MSLQKKFKNTFTYQKVYKSDGAEWDKRTAEVVGSGWVLSFPNGFEQLYLGHADSLSFFASSEIAKPTPEKK